MGLIIGSFLGFQAHTALADFFDNDDTTSTPMHIPKAGEFFDDQGAPAGCKGPWGWHWFYANCSTTNPEDCKNACCQFYTVTHNCQAHPPITDKNKTYQYNSCQYDNGNYTLGVVDLKNQNAFNVRCSVN